VLGKVRLDVRTWTHVQGKECSQYARHRVERMNRRRKRLPITLPVATTSLTFELPDESARASACCVCSGEFLHACAHGTPRDFLAALSLHPIVSRNRGFSVDTESATRHCASRTRKLRGSARTSTHSLRKTAAEARSRHLKVSNALLAAIKAQLQITAPSNRSAHSCGSNHRLARLPSARTHVNATNAPKRAHLCPA